MEGINKKYNIELEVLTPLSIGAGSEKDWVRGVDFIVDGGLLYRLNMKKMLLNGIHPDELASYFTTKNEKGIKSKLAGKLEQVSDVAMPFPAETDNDVKAFVKNQLSGNPLLAGSSLKGSLRSVLFEYLGGSSQDGREVFGSAVKGDEFMRFIKIADSEFLSTELVNTKIFNLQNNGEWVGGWKHGEQKTSVNFKAEGFNTVYECIVPGQKSVSSIMMSEKQFSKISNHVNRNEKFAVLKNDITFLFSIINSHTKAFLMKEKKFFLQYETDKTDLIVKGIDDILNSIPDDNSYCILRMSAGSGFHSITGDWQFNDFSINGIDTSKKVSRGLLNGKKSSKSRKIAIFNDRFFLPGFIKMRSITDDELKKVEFERNAEIQRKESERQAKIEEARQLHFFAQKAEEERKARQLHYNNLVQNATNLYNDGKIEAANEICKQADSLFPENTAHQTLKSLIFGKLNEIEFVRKQRESEERAQQERIAKNAVPLADKISNASKIGTLLGNVETWLKYGNKFSDSDLQALFEKIKAIASSLKGKDLKNFKDFKSWNKTIALVGENTAKKWFDELTK